jgi:hypothetical protein
MVVCMRKLGEALPQVVRDLGITRRTREARALLAWPQVVGNLLAKDARPLRLSGRVLWVSARSPSLAHQLHIESARIVERINELVGEPVVGEIRFRQEG